MMQFPGDFQWSYNFRGFGFPTTVHNFLMVRFLDYCSNFAAKRTEPFFSRLQKVFSALGSKYYLMLTINFCILAIYFCTHEDLEQNPILLLNSLMICLKDGEKFFWIIM